MVIDPSDSSSSDSFSTGGPPGKDSLQILASRGFVDWLSSQNVSLAISAYQTGKLLLLGRNGGRLSLFQRNFERCMGLWSDTQSLYLASNWRLWRLVNVLDPGRNVDGYDRVFVPRTAHTTGDVDVHDIAMDDAGRPLFVSSLFCCLATLSDKYNFTPVWRPPFLSKLAAEDRCHLNGLAVEKGQPRYVTACSQSDVVDGWRDDRRDGGCLIDVDSNEIVLEQLSMPHSPRIHRGRVWLLDSGNGWFGFVDAKTGKFERVTFCPGYARGLSFVGDYALIGVSQPRREAAFHGLALEEELTKRKASPRCGLQVVDLKSGDVVQWLRFEGVVTELYDVIALPHVHRPKAIGLTTNEIRYSVWVDDQGRVMQWTGAQRDQT